VVTRQGVCRAIWLAVVVGGSASGGAPVGGVVVHWWCDVVRCGAVLGLCDGAECSGCARLGMVQYAASATAISGDARRPGSATVCASWLLVTCDDLASALVSASVAV